MSTADNWSVFSVHRLLKRIEDHGPCIICGGPVDARTPHEEGCALDWHLKQLGKDFLDGEPRPSRPIPLTPDETRMERDDA